LHYKLGSGVGCHGLEEEELIQLFSRKTSSDIEKANGTDVTSMDTHEQAVYHFYLTLLRCQCPSVRLSVTEVHWRIMANFIIIISCRLLEQKVDMPQC